MFEEIMEIPEKAEKVYYSTQNISLPQDVPYIGMGSSYFATKALQYLGIPLQSYMASEYLTYFSQKTVLPMGVLISQSGKSSEVIKCKELFQKYIAITNELKSPLCVSTKLDRVFPLLAGKESYSSTKTYINTLITLYNGHGIDPLPAIKVIREKMADYEKWGSETASQIYELIFKGQYKGAFIIGNGPDMATVHHSSLIMSESTTYPFTGMSVAQYDHGPKETAKNSVIIVLKTTGPSYRRTNILFDQVEKAGAHVFYYEEKDVDEKLAPITSSIPLMFMAYHLAKLLKIRKAFSIGKKVTTTE